MGGFGIHTAHERHEGGGNGGCHGALLPWTGIRGKAWWVCQQKMLMAEKSIHANFDLDRLC
jgi:hypothetical protein